MGYDAGKRVKGRKVHALVDTEGLPLRVVVRSTAIQDRDSAPPWSSIVSASASIGSNSSGPTAATTPTRWPRRRRQPPLRVEIVKRRDDSAGFVVLPRRWVVERTLSWFGRNRRLAKDYENLADTLAAFITLACIQLAVRRLARP